MENSGYNDLFSENLIVDHERKSSHNGLVNMGELYREKGRVIIDYCKQLKNFLLKFKTKSRKFFIIVPARFSYFRDCLLKQNYFVGWQFTLRVSVLPVYELPKVSNL